MKKFGTLVLCIGVAFLVLWGLRVYAEQYSAVSEARRLAEGGTLAYLLGEDSGDTTRELISPKGGKGGKNAPAGTQPSLTVSADSGQAPADHLAMGTTNNSLATFRFTETANSEDVRILDLRVFQQVSSTATVRPGFAATRLYTTGGTLLATGGSPQPSVQGNGYIIPFTFAGGVTVQKANSLLLVLKGDVASYSSSGATDNSSHVFTIATSADLSNDTPGETVVAYGGTSNVQANVNISAANGNQMTLLRTKMTFGSSALGVSNGRAKTSVDNFAQLVFTAHPAGPLAINSVVVTFSGTAPASPSFLNGVSLIDENGNALGLGNATSSPCNGSNTCSKTFNLGPGTSGEILSASSIRTWTLRVNSTLTAPAQPNVAQTLSAAINAHGHIRWTDALDAQAVSNLGLPIKVVVPINLNSVSYQVGT